MFEACKAIKKAYDVNQSWKEGLLKTVEVTHAAVRNGMWGVADTVMGRTLVAQAEAPVYGAPLGGEGSLVSARMSLSIAEKLISITGQDFNIDDIDNLDDEEPFCTVKGTILHLPGHDEMTLKMKGDHVTKLERKNDGFKATPTYNVLRDDVQIGWIENSIVKEIRDDIKIDWIENTIVEKNVFEFFVGGAEEKSLFGLFGKKEPPKPKPPPTFVLEGNFSERRFFMRNSKKEVVAHISKDWIFEIDRWNHYLARIAPGMDAGLVVVCACAIDQFLDEQHAEKRKKEKEEKKKKKEEEEKRKKEEEEKEQEKEK